MKSDTEQNPLVFTIDNNSNHVEKFSLLVDYIKKHHAVEDMAYTPAFWNNGHFHFKNKGIVYQLDFNDVLGLDIKLDTSSLTDKELRAAKKFIKSLKEVANG